jgi:hypothetical protein
MLNETLDSLQSALQHSSLQVDLKFCLNSQTYLEKPIEGNAQDMFKQFLNHPVLKDAEIIYKTDEDDFYNIGDWRREVYNHNFKYTVWGESDCLIPEDYFYILSNLHIDEPHILSLASRKCWDHTWNIVEHESLQSLSIVHSDNVDYKKEYFPNRYFDIITQSQLDKFNSEDEVHIKQLESIKIDGSMLALSKGLPTPFISPDMNFVREDYCAQVFFQIKKIPQYHISNRLKGHNYNHPFKRTNTIATRNDSDWKLIEEKNIESMHKFLESLQ